MMSVASVPSAPRHRIAHLSDVHMLDRKRERPTEEHVALRLLSYARVLDPEARVRKLARALEAAVSGGADQLVLSGDLTEAGTAAQFETFAEVLADSRIDPERIVLVPGNHDRYAAEDCWRRALEGPLRPWARGAAEGRAAGKIVERGGVAYVPLDATRFQPFVRSGGELTDAALSALERALASVCRSRLAVVVVQHHPPLAGGSGAWQWWDGLLGQERENAILAHHPNVSLLHGHAHRVSERAIIPGQVRVFGAAAVVDDRAALPRVRFYDVSSDGQVVPSPGRV
jgi:Icc protein